MAIDNFIPVVWSSRLGVHNEKALVYGGLVGRNYQSEVTGAGNAIKINTFGDISIEDYTKNGTISAAEVLTGSQITLNVDQQKSFNFLVGDIDKAQQNPKIMEKAMRRAGYNMSDKQDQFIASLYTDVDAANIVGLGNDTTPVVPTSTDIYGYFTKAKALLRKQNVNLQNAWVVIPPDLEKMLLDSGEFTADTSLGDFVKVEGVIGKVAGFTVAVSNNVPNVTGTKYKIIFGTPEAIEYVDQIENIEAYRPELGHEDAVKGLSVYGGVLADPKGIAVMTANLA